MENNTEWKIIYNTSFTKYFTNFDKLVRYLEGLEKDGIYVFALSCWKNGKRISFIKLCYMIGMYDSIKEVMEDE